MRPYEATHPWLTFSTDFISRLPQEVWLLLGEAQSKCEHIKGVPLRSDEAAEVHRVNLAKGVHATTAIEGNSLSEEEVQARIDGEGDLPPSKEYLGKEVDNVLAAINGILPSIADKRAPHITASEVKRFNALVLHELPLDEGVEPGRIRRHSVGVRRYRGAPHEDCEYLLARLCEWLRDAFPTLEHWRIAIALLKAILAHVYLAWIHPFGDGNGRTARLVEVQILLEADAPSPAVHLLSNHYNRTRAEYYRQLDRASRSGGDVVPFIRYAVQGMVDGLKEQLDVIRNQQWDVAWQNYVHERFRGKTSPADQRRRRLALDLSTQAEPIPVSEARHISTRLAEAYAGKTARTITRDINALIRLGLVERRDGTVRALKETILAFLPSTTLSSLKTAEEDANDP